MTSTYTLPAATHLAYAPSSSNFVSSNHQATPRSRTTSLFSTVSSKMRFGAAKGKGKSAEGVETTRIKSGFLARRLSGGTSNRPSPPRASAMPLSELNGAGSGLASYRERAGTYSRSSPELNGAKESAYQPFPILSIHDDDDEEGEQEEQHDPRLPSSPVAIPAPASRSPRDARTTYQPPSIPFTRTLSTSPPTSILTPEEEEARRLASRAEALAKLTEPRQAFPFPGSPTAPPRPSRTPPPPPLELPAPNQTRWSVEREWLVEDPSIRRRKSVNAENRGRHRSAGETAHGPRPTFVPVVQAPSPPPKPKGALLRWSSSGSVGELEVGIPKEELETGEGFRRGLRRVRSLLRREVGVDGKETEDDETVIRRTLEDGSALCRLINSLHSTSPHILPAEIDTTRSPSSAHANLCLFFEAAISLYDIPPTDQFDSSDLTSPSRSSLLKVLRTLTLLEHLAYHNPRRSASSLSPTSLPMDINLRGRAVRARNTNTGGSATSFGHSFESSTGSDGSPNSSRFTDYSFVAPRKSLEVPPPSTGPSVTFVERAKASDREKDWGAPAGNVGNNKIYGDRRMSESAIDVLSVVEEDDNAAGTGIHVPKRGGLGRQSTSPSPTPRRPKRFSSDAAPVLWLEGGAGGSPKPRQRHSSDMARPVRLAKRSVSSSAAEQTTTQREEFGPIKISTELRRRSTDSHRAVTPSENIPFPSSTSTETTRTPAVAPRPRQHKRWNSEVYVERTLVGKEEHASPARSRHESFQNPSPLKEQGVGGKGKVTRTKLVLREEGRPTLTYQLGECIGRGQFGSVYRALNLNSGRVVAVKRILLEGKSEEEVQQLSNEVSMLKSLDHPSVVKYEGLVRTEHYLNIVLEFIENGSLQKTLKAFGDLPEGLVASYVVKILEGLDYLHSMNVVHCDLKGEPAANILTTKNGNIKLSDFGVSLNLNALQNQKADHDVNGTPNWMAPEVIELKGASTASDIWSLGCTIVELIDGRPPYSEMVAMSAMFRIVEDDRPPIPERCSPELFDFLSQCFAKEPQDRPTANELFAHEWLQSNWDPRKDLRPQDSIPFLRRISSEMRRPDLTTTFDSPSPLARSASPVEDIFGTSPSSPRGLIFPESGQRDSFDGNGSRPNLRESISFTHESDDSPRPHTFVKTTFSKAVDCRLCGEETKRHAVLCRDCGLIAHARCVEFAPSCNLRAQLLSYSTTNLALRSPLSRSSSIPTSPVLSPTSPAGFSLGDILPFGKARRPKITPGSSDTSIARTSTDSHASASTPSRPSNALRHLSDLIGVKSRTPEATPPSSLSKSYTHIASDSLGSSQSSRRGGSPEQEEVGRGPPPSQQGGISLDRGPSNPLSRKLSFAQGTRLKKTHGRSVSQPVNKPPKSTSEDCVVQ